MRLQGKTALITGAASGIGAACAIRFAEEGARIASLDVQKPPDEIWSRITAQAPDAIHLEGSVCDEARLCEVMESVASRLGGPDVVVNSAGTAGGGAVHLLSSEEWDRVLDVNLKGTFLVCKHALVRMLAQGGGNIVNISSIEGLEGTNGGSAYNASKFGVIGLTKNLAMDYARRGIRVNAICPGFIQTPMLASVLDSPAMQEARARIIEHHQLGRLGRPEEIAAAALFLASEDSSFVTGHALPVDGGFTAGHRTGATKLLGLE